MKLVFSRKGFDSTAGGAPSPIIGGIPLSLPIPTKDRSCTRYDDRGLGDAAARATRGKITGADFCHDDPMFSGGLCWFGQCGAAQGHLAKHGVGPGDIFLFFGLFADPQTGERHHRIFGYMQVLACAAPDLISASPHWQAPPRPHPHLEGRWPANNTIWLGVGATATSAHPALRLTRLDGPLNMWEVPHWLKTRGLSYHHNPARWIGNTGLDSVRRGQEFVSDIGRARKPRLWVDGVIDLIQNG